MIKSMNICMFLHGEQLERKSQKKKRKQRTHYLNEMTCAEIVLGKINRTKTDPLRFFRCSFIFTATLSF